MLGMCKVEGKTRALLRYTRDVTHHRTTNQCTAYLQRVCVTERVWWVYFVVSVFVVVCDMIVISKARNQSLLSWLDPQFLV